MQITKQSLKHIAARSLAGVMARGKNDMPFARAKLEAGYIPTLSAFTQGFNLNSVFRRKIK